MVKTSVAPYSYFKQDLRLDAEYYKPEYLEEEKQIRKNKYFEILDKVVKRSRKRFNPFRDPEGNFYYIEIDNINLSDGRFIFQAVLNSQAPSRARKLLEYGDILISTVRPNRNAVSIVLNKEDHFVCSTGFAVIKATGINPLFLFAYLKTRFAIDQLVRKTSAAMYPAVGEDEILAMGIVKPPESFQLKIEKEVNLAFEKQKQADQAYAKAEDILLASLGCNDFIPSLSNSRIINHSDVRSSLRMDARYYLSKYQDAINLLENSGYQILRVKDIISEPLKSGATPLARTNAYIDREFGIPFFRIVNIENYQLTTDDVLYIRPDIHQTALRRSKIKPGDILFSIAGTIGLCVVVPEAIKEGNINQALAILRVDKNFDPYYVSLYFNSIIGKLISEKISRPVVQSNLNLTELETLLVPKLPESVQHKISGSIQESFKLREEGRGLLKAAIQEIERFIETD